MKFSETLSLATVVKIAESHINRYKDLIALCDSGQPGIRRGECAVLVKIWESAKVHTLGKEPLTEEEEGELADAVLCGSHTDLLTAEELAALPDSLEIDL